MEQDPTQLIYIAVDRKVRDLMHVDRLYVALYNRSNRQVRFPCVTEGKSILPAGMPPWEERPCPQDGSLLDLVITHGVSLRFNISSQQILPKDLVLHGPVPRDLTYWPGVMPEEASWLGAPMQISTEWTGALVVEKFGRSGVYGDYEQRLVEMVARQGALALQNAWLMGRLEHQIRNLGTVSSMGADLIQQRSEQEILELVYQQITRLGVSTGNIFIALYDPPSTDGGAILRPMFVVQDSRRVDLSENSDWQPRLLKEGLAAQVIQTCQPVNLAIVGDEWSKFAEDERGDRPRSCIGVPMLSEAGVLGVIILRDFKQANAYSSDNEEVLLILATQAAAALQNQQLIERIQREQEQRVALEKLSVMASMAEDFAHRMNNLAGAIPVRIQKIRRLLQADRPTVSDIQHQLDKLEEGSQEILRAARLMRQEQDRSRKKEPVTLPTLIQIAASRAVVESPGTEQRVRIELSGVEPDLPEIVIERERLLGTLINVIKNGLDAIEGKGVIRLAARLVRKEGLRWMEIAVSDTGKGIPKEILPKIFDLFFSTKRNGMGYGLWRDKAFMREMRGDIDVRSEDGKGSTFILRFPIDAPLEPAPAASEPGRSQA